jgi:hypothetical protein
MEKMNIYVLFNQQGNLKKKSDIISRAQNIISVTNTGDEINGENYDFILGLLKTMTNGNIKLQMVF